MRIRVLGISMLMVFVVGGWWLSTPAAAQNQVAGYEIDPVHSSVVFKVRHLGVASFYGRFNDISGSFNFDKANAAGSSFKIEIGAASVYTNNEDRDNHLRSEDFLLVNRYPTITFESTAVKQTGDGQYEVAGNLTLRGVTKPLTASVTHIGEGDRGRRGYLCGFEIALTINRSEFGVRYGEGALGEQVHLMIGLEGRRQ